MLLQIVCEFITYTYVIERNVIDPDNMCVYVSLVGTESQSCCGEETGEHGYLEGHGEEETSQVSLYTQQLLQIAPF